MIAKGFKREDGPFVRTLDAALESFEVRRQSYYGGTFVGNHVHLTLEVGFTNKHKLKYVGHHSLQPDNIRQLCKWWSIPLPSIRKLRRYRGRFLWC